MDPQHDGEVGGRGSARGTSDVEVEAFELVLLEMRFREESFELF